MKQKKSLDLATVVGFVVGLGSILASVLIEGRNPLSYFNISAGLLVFGGTFGVACIAFPLSVVKRIPKLIMHSM